MTIRALGIILLGAIVACHCRAENTDTGSVGKLAITHFVPWMALNQSVAMSQRYYDMPLQPAGPDRVSSLRVEIELMAKHGIDAVATDIVPGKERWGYLDNFGWMLEAATGTSVGIFPCLNSVPDDPSTAEQLRLMVERWGAHPNWLHVNGRPVISTFWGGKFSPEVYHRLEERLAKHDISFFWLGDPDWIWNRPQSVESLRRYAGVFDVIYSFAEYGRDGKQSPLQAYQTLAAAAPVAAKANAWAAGIAPGYLGGWIPGRNDYYIPFRNLDQFVDVWENTIQTRPDWVYLTTWNDRDETHIQPSLYQWETLVDISSYYIRLWKTGAPPDQPQRLYAAYPREQLLGTVQRIELLSLAGSAGGANSTATLKLLDADGQTLTVLPERTLSCAGMQRVDWAVDTLPFAAQPIIYPVIVLKQAKSSSKEYRLPAFVLRSGWIENQNIVKFPLARSGDGRAMIHVVLQPDGLVRTEVKYDGVEPLKSVEIFRNDMRMAAIDPTNSERPRVQLLITAKDREFPLQIKVQNGRILRALRSDLGTPERLRWDANSLWTRVGRSQMTAFELEATTDTLLSFSKAGGQPVAVSLDSILAAEGSTEINGVPVSVALAKFDALADASPPLPDHGSLHELSAVLNLGTPRSNDSYHARLETLSGEIIETPWVFPSQETTKLRPISIIRSSVSMDARNEGDYFSLPSAVPISVERVDVDPVILQVENWNFNEGANPGYDSAGRNNLILGRGEGYLKIDPKRVPQWLSGEGPDHSGCLFFDGIDDRAQLPVQQEPKGPFRIAFDLNPSGPPKGWQNILTGLGDSDQENPGIIIRLLENGRLAAGRAVLGLVKSPHPIAPGEWTHVEVQFTGNQTRLLINNELVASQDCAPTFRRFSNSRVYLGGPSSPFHGKIDNVLIEGFSPASP